MALSVSGIDYAWGSPSPKVLKASGYRFAMRYLSHDPSKNLTLREKQALAQQGIGVGVVWESTANRTLGGFPAGRADALAARQQANAAGLVGAPIYFAVDFDATGAQLNTVAAYLKGAASVLGHARVGVYGGYNVVAFAAQHNACKWFWQTYAWSGGHVHPQTHVYQYRNGVRIDGVSCDLNKAQADAGIVYPTAHTPDPKARKRRVWRKHLATAVTKVRRLRGLLRKP